MIDPSVHVIAALTVASRIADVWTTYQVTPTLKLEANSLARRFGWRFALLTILAGLIPYWSPPLGVILLTMSFVVAASNAAKIASAKVLGEAEMAAMSRRIILATPPWPGLLYLIMPGLLIGVLGASMLVFYPDGSRWGYYFALGLLAYTLAVCVWTPIRYFNVRKESRKAG